MNEFINRVELKGRLTRDAEKRFTTSGHTVTRVGLATNRSVKSANGERRDVVTYHNVCLWASLATQAAELRKGQWLHVRGRLTDNSWKDQHGDQRRTTEIVAEEIVPLGDTSAAPAAAGLVDDPA